MPSSTSPPADFFDYLEKSFRLLEAGMPAAYEAVCATAAGLSARLVANGQPRVLTFHGSIPVFEPDRVADVEVAFDNRIILDLIEGQLSLEEALLCDRLHIRGAPAAVERLHAALMHYLNGTVRVIECLTLLRRFQQACSVSD
jgi:hypothetical protein